MCSVSALGQTGTLSALPGYDYIAQAYTGIMGVTGDPDGAPAFPVAGVGDVAAGTHAAAAIGYALLHRARGGEGQYIDISLADAYMGAHELNLQIYSVSNGETEPTRSGKHHYAVCPLGLFQGKEHWLCIIALQPQWSNLCRAMGRPELTDDPRYDVNEKRVAASTEVIAIVQSWLDQMPSDEAVLEKLALEHVPCAPVLRISEVVTHPHMLERGIVRKISDPKVGDIVIPGMPLRFSGFQHNAPLESAYLGEHNIDVLSNVLDYSAERIAALSDGGVLQANADT